MTDAPIPPHFSGSIPRHYDEYLGPLFFEDYARDIASRIDPAKVRFALELSCGTGRVTNHIRRALHSAARLVASDVSPDMLEVAKEKLKGHRVEWLIADFTKIPFADNSLDLVVCCFGYMFAEDKIAAFTEALRVLQPGGSLLMSTWGKLSDNAASNVFRTAIKKYFGDTLPPTYQIPYSMHDPDLIHDQLLKAGFTKVKVELVDKRSVCETAKKATVGLVRGGSLYSEIVKRNPAWIEEISADVENELSEKFGAAPMVAPMRALVCEASKG